MHLLPASLIGVFSLLASAQVPTINDYNNRENNWGYNGQNNGGNNENWNQGVNNYDLSQSSSVLVISGKFRQMYLYINANIVNPQMTRQQADQAALRFAQSQSPSNQQLLKNMHFQINGIADRLGGIYAEGRSVLSPEALQFYNELNRVNADQTLTLAVGDQRIQQIIGQYGPRVVNEVLRFDRQGLQIFTQRFNCPMIAGKPIFAQLLPQQCANMNGNWNNNGWGNGNNWNNNNNNNPWGNNGNNQFPNGNNGNWKNNNPWGGNNGNNQFPNVNGGNNNPWNNNNPWGNNNNNNNQFPNVNESNNNPWGNNGNQFPNVNGGNTNNQGNNPWGNRNSGNSGNFWN
ncbi:hypothetical protein L596_009605 [Steinernema carpocapsae]|uniref:SXP/RAL-2 family protein Ani s 5-like cation-binding domain-containing protein n=1 Tax=Steinernema carpocapsae TaxID=34508 RepID=A0A4V6A6S9_STECR|nr:hypothetical protein L596_009605 [Steinernema carpocapsae]